MQFRAEEYYQASLERMKQALTIHKSGDSSALVMYCAGLAVECMLRAFRWKKDDTFEGRHDLADLLKASGILKIDDEYMRHKGYSEDAIQDSGLALRASMNEVIILWHNNLRFASEARLKAFLKRIGRLKRIKGDPLKKNAADLLEAAQVVINRGILLWESKKKS